MTTDRVPVHAKLRQAINDYVLRRGRSPHYVVMDAESFLNCVTESWFPPLVIDALTEIGITQTTIMGLIVVVIPTDGIPLLRVTGWPAAEAIDLTRERHVEAT